MGCPFWIKCHCPLRGKGRKEFSYVTDMSGRLHTREQIPVQFWVGSNRPMIYIPIYPCRVVDFCRKFVVYKQEGLGFCWDIFTFNKCFIGSCSTNSSSQVPTINMGSSPMIWGAPVFMSLWLRGIWVRCWPCHHRMNVQVLRDEEWHRNNSNPRFKNWKVTDASRSTVSKHFWCQVPSAQKFHVL